MDIIVVGSFNIMSTLIFALIINKEFTSEIKCLGGLFEQFSNR